MRLAVTGASGLIGAHVVRAALTAGHAATAVVRAASCLDALARTDVPVAVGDVLGAIDRLIAAFEGADVVVHTAATFAYGGDGAAIHRVAVDGTANVLRAAVAAGARRVVVTSS